MRAVGLMTALAFLSGVHQAAAEHSADTPPESHASLCLDLGGGVELDLVWIEPGTFVMGSPEEERLRGGDEGPQHRVVISRGFWMGRYEVTQRQYKRLMNAAPSSFKTSGLDAPVERVSWIDAKSFCARLQHVLPGRLQDRKARLPTEAEWEYACRAGTVGPYAGDLDQMGWYRNNADRKTHRVGQKQKNAWGLYDMHGSVWEWCEDAKRDYTASTQTNPVGMGPLRALRGGCWYGWGWTCRSATRSSDHPASLFSGMGFRVVVQ